MTNVASRLAVVFDAYGRLVESRLQSPARRSQRRVAVITNLATRVRELVESLEEEALFSDLVTATREAFSEHDSKRAHRSIWEHATRSFFRRSGFYLDAARSRRLDVKKYFSKYETAFSRSEDEVTYLAPMELVRLAKERFSFEGFSVRRFSRDKLAVLLQAEVNRVFYPWAAVDTDVLSPYWFICRTLRRPRPKPFWNFRINLTELDKVKPYQIPFPSLGPALLPLVLYRWQANLWRNEPVESQEHWMGFRLPFVLVCTNDLLTTPRRAPDLRELQTTPLIDTATGEELGEEPEVAINLNSKETTEFESLVRHFARLLSTLKLDEHGWQFVSVAGGYLVKAFFAHGMEQLLWHITALESLLGEKAEGIVQRVANRIGVILGATDKERKALRRQYKDLYDFRSALVHGRHFEQQVLTRHLREARDLARAVLAWVLTCLAHFQRAGGGGSVPTREDLLRLLDLGEAARVRMSKALAKLPASFPRIKGWSPP